jgi:hypothetical protein
MNLKLRVMYNALHLTRSGVGKLPRTVRSEVVSHSLSWRLHTARLNNLSIWYRKQWGQRGPSGSHSPFGSWSLGYFETMRLGRGKTPGRKAELNYNEVKDRKWDSGANVYRDEGALIASQGVQL